jgi:uncharacterized membrane protein YfcA
METALLAIGVGVGALSGFFGMGGGTVLVPILLLLGLGMKDAVGISIMQMVFSSIYGSYLNTKKGSLTLGEGLYVGFGGFTGGYLSGYLTSSIPDLLLQVTFIAFVLFAIIRMAFAGVHEVYTEDKRLHPLVLFTIGAAIGVVAISIGIGGAIILIPLLSGILHYPVKKAVSAGLFFVVFSSIAGFTGRLVHGEIDLYKGAIIGIGSLIGVWIGIRLKEHISNRHHKTFIIVMYSIILLIMLYKLLSRQ